MHSVILILIIPLSKARYLDFSCTCALCVNKGVYLQFWYDILYKVDETRNNEQ